MWLLYNFSLRPLKTFRVCRYGTIIIRKYRKHLGITSLTRGHDVTFGEFLRFIADSKDPGAFDPHWLQYHRLCDPCYWNFDFIGKLETLKKDSSYVLKHIKAEAGFDEFPSSEHGPASSNSSNSFREYYSKIPAYVIEKIKDIYHWDFQLFGYEPDINAYL